VILFLEIGVNALMGTLEATEVKKEYTLTAISMGQVAGVLEKAICSLC
jgi:hypothetical protein